MAVRTGPLSITKQKACIAIGLAAVLSLGAFSAQADVELEAGVAPHPEIDALYHKLSDAVASLDTKSFSEIYAKDAFYLVPTSPLIQGLDGVKSNWDGWFTWMKDAKGTLQMDFKVIAREVHDDSIGYDIAYVSTLQKRPNEPDRTYEAKFVVVTKKQADGEWRYQVDAYNLLKKEE